MKSSITFVTAFINLYEKPLDYKDNEWRYDNFKKLASSGINICLYTNTESYERLSEIIADYPNVKLMEIFNLEDTLVYNCKNLDYNLPDNRNEQKDTEKYIFLINSKIEIVNDALKKNVWDSTHFAWIDFSIAYIFKNIGQTIEHLSILGKRTFIEKLLVIPGCWKTDTTVLTERVNWRFCGGFFLGDYESITNFYELYKQHFENFILEHKKLVWEVNFWAWLELNTDWKPDWYLADHDDSILNIPTRYYALLLNDKLSKTLYDYPPIHDFFPSSACYLNYHGKDILNTRFVNYSYYPNGTYNINDKNNKIITKNVLSILDSMSMKPFQCNEMDESTVGLVSHDMYSVGLEDIRLYNFENVIKFIATNVNYVGSQANRMIIGEYDINNFCYKNVKIIQPPISTGCEKNWIPISFQKHEELFIYKWSPFQIGKIDENNCLEIIKSYNIKSPDFHRIRGSSIFIENGEHDNLIGVVHFCEETTPRQYYHMLVIIDKTLQLPSHYSEPFCFQHHGIEFCIGFTIKDDNYVFWVSKKDNDAVMVTINKKEIAICNEVAFCL